MRRPPMQSKDDGQRQWSDPQRPQIGTPKVRQERHCVRDHVSPFYREAKLGRSLPGKVGQRKTGQVPDPKWRGVRALQLAEGGMAFLARPFATYSIIERSTEPIERGRP